MKKISRPPIVSVLGHVDHGKTTLLDKIRKTNLAAREAGGITQHIGAYQIQSQGKKITFIDTPGHEAFAAMRSRGAKVADIVVLVVAANDGVMPQTREALSHIKEARVPFLVAMTKIDLPSAQIEKVKSQLVEAGVALEGRGGDVVAVGVSGKTGEGIAELLEMINLLAELSEISGDPAGELSAVIIETKKDKRGPLASILVREGTIRVGDEISAEGIFGRVRGFFDENKRPKKEVVPGEPAEVIGFETLPPIGSIVSQRQKETVSVKFPVQAKAEVAGFPAILKADTQGTLEALSDFLGKNVGVITGGVGDVTESDVILAGGAGALIVGFNVKVPLEVAKLAEEEEVRIVTGNVIYELKKEVEDIISGKTTKPSEKILGKAEIIAEFPYGEKGRIAGTKVLEGRIAKQDLLTLIRADSVIRENLRIASMKQLKADISKAEAGQEFGLVFSGSVDFAVGDVIVSRQPSAPQNA